MRSLLFHENGDFHGSAASGWKHLTMPISM